MSADWQPNRSPTKGSEAQRVWLKTYGVGGQWVLSQILCIDEVGLERRRGLPRQRIELLRWRQFSRRPQLPFSDHVHELDPGERHCS